MLSMLDYNSYMETLNRDKSTNIFRTRPLDDDDRYFKPLGGGSEL